MTYIWPLNDLKWPIRTWKFNFLTKSHFGACNLSFFKVFLNAELIALIRFNFQVSKWPPNDLKWPIRTWKHNFLTKSHLGACNISLNRFLWTPSRLPISDLSSESLNDLQMTSKWPKLPIRTWKHNFLTKSHFWAFNMSFHRFLWTLSRLRLSDLSFESPNDLQMTSKWPTVTSKQNFFAKSHFGACYMSLCSFLGTLSRLHTSDLCFESQNDLNDL